MYRWTVLIAAAITLILVAIGCSSGGNNPVAPSDLDMAGPTGQAVQPQNHLWGYYDCYVDLDSQTVVANLNRSVMFAANVVTFVNGNPANLQFQIISTPIEPTHIDVDINVGITHPFPGMNQYDGYDVRGIFIGDGSGGLDYNSDLDCPELGTDQIIVGSEGPGGTDGAPDGYTRWWNPSEFTSPGILGYTPGLFASPGYTGDATLNGYKYFADGLGMTDDVFGFLLANPGDFGVFTAGTTNRRNYYLRFPNAKGVSFNYAICANWEAETVHPSNAQEAIGCRADLTPDVYFVDASDNGGKIKLDLSIWSWDPHPQPTAIYIESNVVSSMYTLDATDMTPTGGDLNHSTYYCEVDADNVTGVEGNNFWVICEYPDEDYTNDLGVPNTANTDNLAAFFRYDIFTAIIPYNLDPDCDLQIISPTMPYAGWAVDVEFDASGSTDPDVGDVLQFEWDFDDDGVFGDPYDSGTDEMPIKNFDSDYVGNVCVKVTDGNGGEDICCVDVDITAFATKNIDLRSGVDARDIAVVKMNGDLYILYSDGQVWKYTEANYYQSGSMLYFSNNVARFMDASANGDSIVSGPLSGGGSYCRSFYASGGGAANHTSFKGPDWSSEVWCPTGGYQVDKHCSWYDCNYSTYPTIVWFWQPPTYGGAGGNFIYEGTGPGSIDHNYLVGVEADTNSYVYCLEKAPEYRVERRYYWFTSQNGPYWGGYGDTSPSFNDPRDITRDTGDTIYVLDELSTGNPAIKKFTSTGTPQGTFGDTTSISSTPLRIEGSERLWGGAGDNLMFVLHGNASDGYFLSIFMPNELT